MIVTIFNVSLPLLFFWHKLDSTAEKTHPQVKLINKPEKMRNVETMTLTIFPQKPFILYIITETVPFNYIISAPRASIIPREINTTFDKDFLT